MAFTLSNSKDKSVEVVNRVVKNEFNNGQSLCFVPEGGCYQYNFTHWKPLKEAQLSKLFFDDFCQNYPELEHEAEYQAKKCVKHAALKYMRSEGLPNPAKGIINLKNGELNVSSTGHAILKKHSPSSGQQWCLKVAYDPAAKAPMFMQTIHEIFAECKDTENVVRHYLELMGYIITSSRDHAVIGMCIGSGSNGKTKLMQTTTRLLGKDTVLNRSMRSMNNDNFFDIDLYGKALYLDDDLAMGTTLADGKLKSLSEEKTITARPPGGRSISFTVKAIPFLLANHMPRTLDISYGMRRRVHMFKFDRVFENSIKNDNLFPKIWENELPGILNLYLEGYQRLQERGDFLIPDEMIDNVDKWLAEVNVVPAFIEHCCEVNPSKSVKGSNLFNYFRLWAKECGYRNLPNRTQFYSDIESQNFHKTKPQNAITFTGITIKEGGEGT